MLRNISWELKLEADLDRLRSDRESVVAAMTGVRVGATIEATAASFCLAVTRLEDIELARVLLVEADDRVIPLGITGRAYLDWEVGVPVAFPQLAEIVAVTRSGSWWQPLADAVPRRTGRPIRSIHRAGRVRLRVDGLRAGVVGRDAWWRWS